MEKVYVHHARYCTSSETGVCAVPLTIVVLEDKAWHKLILYKINLDIIFGLLSGYIEDGFLEIDEDIHFKRYCRWASVT